MRPFKLRHAHHRKHNRKREDGDGRKHRSHTSSKASAQMSMAHDAVTDFYTLP
jgi:hypothetical protein